MSRIGLKSGRRGRLPGDPWKDFVGDGGVAGEVSSGSGSPGLEMNASTDGEEHGIPPRGIGLPVDPVLEAHRGGPERQ